jgi:pimeloyl-ACP methyl ester carboxylesterase
VEFRQGPEYRPYGLEAVVHDLYDNTYALLPRKPLNTKIEGDYRHRSDRIRPKRPRSAFALHCQGVAATEISGTSVAERYDQRCDLVVDGRRLETLYYPTSGDRPTIVMLHEGLGSVSTWKDFPEQLAQATGCGVLAYSRYGHGKSERLGEKRRPGFMHHEAIIVLPALLDQLGIQDPILLGHSDGGSIAIIYVAASLRGPRALILVAPHVFVEDRTVQSIAKIRGVYQTTDLSAKMTRHHDHADEMFWGWNDIWLDPEFRGWNIEDCLDSVHCPVLTIQCANDEYGTLAQIRAIERRVSSAQTVVLQDCGHAPHKDQPAETLKAMSEFVRQVCSN